MKKADVLLGIQWGDEGKGKIVDVLTPTYDLIARMQGGPNAGHTLIFGGNKYVLNTIPSGIFCENTLNLIGNGVVIDPITIRRELETLKTSGYDPIANKKLVIARKASIIIPTHQLLDAAYEASLGDKKIGSTLKGISPTYTDKVSRKGLRIGDIELSNFKEKYERLKKSHLDILDRYNFNYSDLAEREAKFFDAIEYLKQIEFVDGEYLVNKYIQEGKKILGEGAQGALLDIDFGSYPFVTSSSTITAGACTGLGIAPQHIGEVIGIFKAYATRVGSGPFPSELDNEIGEKIRQIGFEFGATTGRSRRTGWIDLPALRYSIMINGITQLVMTKADVLTGFDEIGICTHYDFNGKIIDYMPYDITEQPVKPVVKMIKGWSEDITNIKTVEEIPTNLKNYIDLLEKELGVKIKFLSVGPDRVQTIKMF